MKATNNLQAAILFWCRRTLHKRQIRVMVIRPSEDLRVMASRHSIQMPGGVRRFLRNVGSGVSYGACKGAYAPKLFAHPDRLMFPLQRKGERGFGEWERVSWEAAIDDIAARLRKVIDTNGPEGFAVATSNWYTTVDNGMCRRFMNLLGSTNFISGVAYCMGNTAAARRMVYGWYPRADILNSKCILPFGHNPRRHCWTSEFKMVRVAQAIGAKPIMLDPRKSENAEAADLWLPL